MKNGQQSVKRIVNTLLQIYMKKHAPGLMVKTLLKTLFRMKDYK